MQPLLDAMIALSAFLAIGITITINKVPMIALSAVLVIGLTIAILYKVLCCDCPVCSSGYRCNNY